MPQNAMTITIKSVRIKFHGGCHLSSGYIRLTDLQLIDYRLQSTNVKNARSTKNVFNDAGRRQIKK